MDRHVCGTARRRTRTRRGRRGTLRRTEEQPEQRQPRQRERGRCCEPSPKPRPAREPRDDPGAQLPTARASAAPTDSAETPPRALGRSWLRRRRWGRLRRGHDRLRDSRSEERRRGRRGLHHRRRRRDGGTLVDDRRRGEDRRVRWRVSGRRRTNASSRSRSCRGSRRSASSSGWGRLGLGRGFRTRARSRRRRRIAAARRGTSTCLGSRSRRWRRCRRAHTTLSG